MAKNQIQCQPGMSLMTFLNRYGGEEQCREALVKARWPRGFRCQACDHTSHCHLKRRDVYQCNRCKRQTSLTSGTLFAESKLPLRTWFLAIYLLTQHKIGISALALHRQLGVSYNTAWLLKHKLMQAMVERDGDLALDGIVQMDDAYWGGERHGGGVGRGSPGKSPFVAAVQCTPEGHCLVPEVRARWSCAIVNRRIPDSFHPRNDRLGRFIKMRMGQTGNQVVAMRDRLWVSVS